MIISIKQSRLNDIPKIIEDEKVKCPYCKKILKISTNQLSRKELSKCTHCYKDIVVQIDLKQVIYKTDIKIKKIV